MPSTSPADAAALAAATAALPYIEDWIAYRAWKLRVPGVQYAVWFDGKVQLAGATGFADLESGTAMTPRHLFRIASHSKTFVATAILQLADAGTVRLDAPLADYVPELADAPSAIGAVSVRSLLEHGAGVIRDGLDGDFWQHARPFPDEDELIAIARDAGIKSDENASFNYSNIGYSLLGLIVSRTSGVGFREYLTTRIAEPLGLSDTSADYVPDRAADYASGYTGFQTSLDRRRIPHVDTGAMSAATGVTSTASDLVRYFAAHRIGSGELLSDRMKRAQQRRLWSTSTAEEGSHHYGLGMIIDKVAGRWVFGHSGGYPGHITKSFVDPADGIAISVLTNAADGPAAELATGILTLLDAALVQPPRRSLAAPSAELGDTSRFEGRFACLFDVLDVVRLGDRLVGISPSGPDPLESLAEFEVVDDATLRVVRGDPYHSVGELVPYERDASGATVSVRVLGGMTAWPFDVRHPEAFRAPWPQYT